MPEFEYNGHRISYDDYGAGERPLVLIHGLLMNRRMYDRLAPEMARRGNRVIAIDLLGHGRSDRPTEMSQYSMTFFARQVEDEYSVALTGRCRTGICHWQRRWLWRALFLHLSEEDGSCP